MKVKKTVIGDQMIENRLKENSSKLGISIDELIDRYIRLGLFTDDYYEPPQLTREELIEISKEMLKKTKGTDFLLKNITLMFLLENLIGMIN